MNRRKIKYVKTAACAAVLSLTVMMAGCGGNHEEKKENSPKKAASEDKNTGEAKKEEPKDAKGQKTGKSEDGVKEEKKEEQTKAAETENQNGKKTEEVYSAYQKIISEYEDALTSGSDLSDENAFQNSYPHVNELAIFLLSSSGTVNGRVQYCYYDIDGNGVPELLLRNMSDSPYGQDTGTAPMDVYTYDGKGAYKLFDDDTLAERSHMTIYEDGTIYIYGSGGASYGAADFYKIGPDGFTPVLEKEYMFDSEKYPDRPFYCGHESYSIEEFEQLLDKTKKAENFDWEDIAVYVPAEKKEEIQEQGTEVFSTNPELVYETEDKAAVIEEQLDHGNLTQSELNQSALELYNLWDGALNTMWQELKGRLDAQTMENLKEQQIEWIAYKESEVEAAGAEFEGGTMEPMVRCLKGAQLTKERVYELLNY